MRRRTSGASPLRGRIARPALICLLALPAAANPPARYTTGTDQTYVHRINLIDADGNTIGPDSGAPYSPSRTCGKCHDVERVSMGRHFDAGFPGVEDGRPGEPWILWDAVTGTQMPLSHRSGAAAAGARHPADLGLTDWEFASLFGRHHPGGGVLAWLKDGRRRDAVDESFPPGGAATDEVHPPQWARSGALEIDCLACHANGSYSNGNRWSMIHEELNFRGAPTVAAGLGVIRTSVKDQHRLEESYGNAGPAGASYLDKGPVVHYNAARFDPDGRVFLDITRRPPARNCLFCHAVRVPGVTDPSAPERDMDVHLAAGMSCTDCHRNGIDHDIVRGDGSEIDARRQPGAASLSCRGCHMIGRLGAPGIAHPGLPPLHLERISCTACHSGPSPRRNTGRIQTARAHALGLETFVNIDTRALPAIQAPVFKTDADGVVRLQAAIWPAWYGVRKDGALVPVPLQCVRDAIAKGRQKWEDEAVRKPAEAEARKRNASEEEIIKAGEEAVAAKLREWTAALKDAEAKARADAEAEIRKKAAAAGRTVVEEEIRSALDVAVASVRMRAEDDHRIEELPFILEALGGQEKADAAYVAGGKVARLDGGKLVYEEDAPEARPVAWPIAHNVRPTPQALGAKSCSDCHTRTSPFFFGEVTAAPDPLESRSKPVIVSQFKLMGFSGKQRQYQGFVAAVVTFFRVLTLVVIGGMFLHIGLDVLARLRHRKKEQTHASPPARPGEMVQRFGPHYLAQHLLLMLGVTALFLSGFFQWWLRFPGGHWASIVTGSLGGIDLWRVVHRAGGVLLLVSCIYHAVYSVAHPQGRRDFVRFLPCPTDFREFGQNVAWFVGLRKERPRFGRFTYYEKFDYWAVFWGCAIMFGTGVAMWFPELPHRLLPGNFAVVMDTLKEAHAHEAILAFLAISIWHMYNVHFRPGRFPGSMFFLHGRLSHEEMVEEHPRELEGNG